MCLDGWPGHSASGASVGVGIIRESHVQERPFTAIDLARLARVAPQITPCSGGKITGGMGPGDTGKPSVWKERREWLAAILGSIALCVSVGGFLISRKSFDSGKAHVLAAEKANTIDGAHGLSFTFHPLNQAEKILTLSMTAPPVITTASHTGEPPNQELDLAVFARLVGHYRFTRYPPRLSRFVFWEGKIPVILEAQYVVGDEGLTHRALYKISTRITVNDSELPIVTFQDFAFARTVDEGSDYGQILSQALTAEKKAQRDLFNPSQ